MTDWNYVIWKYEAVKQPDGKYAQAFIPPDAKIIRMDHVDDGFYKGDFIWAIVNPTADIDWRLVEWNPDLYKFNPMAYSYKNIIDTYDFGVLEEQDIYLPRHHNILGIRDIRGRLYLYCEDLSENDPENPTSKVKLAIYKTGQDFKHDVDKMEYLGFCRIFVKQELGLYVFKVNL